MKRSIVVFCLLVISFSALTQDKLLTIEDALVKNRTTLAPENLRQLQFIYGKDEYVYLKKVDNNDVWVKGTMGAKTEEPFLTLEQLNEKLAASGIETVTSMPAIQFNRSPDWIMTIKGNKVAYNPADQHVRIMIDKNIASKENVEESSEGYIAYVDNYNLFVSRGNETKQVTTDGSEEIVYASPVHQQEFGITKGTFWSNDGKMLAFYRMNQSMVPDYPIIDWSQKPARVVNIKYPMAGEPSHHVTVGVYNPEKESLVYLNTGEPAEQYLTNIAWSPDDKFIFIAVLNRQQNHMKLNQYNAATGAFMKTLFEEKDQKYVEPLVPMLFVKNKPAQFIWQSSRNGWNHIYLYNANGKLAKQLTNGQWEVLEVKGFDEKGENFFFMSTEESPLTKNLYSVNVKTGKRKRITADFAVHTTQVSNSGKYVIDNVSDINRPRLLQLVETSTGRVSKLLEAPDPLLEYSLGQMSIFTIKNADGTPLYCRLYKPVNFDADKKYPVIVYWYGGPHAQMITTGYNGGASDYWFQYMAQRGYVVFTIDTRGSDNRGRAFESAIFRKAGDAQMDDLLKGVNYLHSLSYVDKANMGLFGWSYGGFLTVNFLLTHPEYFKVGVAGGPVIDWKYYEIMYTERYMDTPQDNAAGFSSTDLTQKVDKLQGKLLLIHGLQDNVVVQQHSIRFVKAAVDKNIQVDYMVYPGHGHNVLGKDRAHLYQKVTNYFMDYLQ